MKVVLDACVLFPTVMREMLMGAAASGMCQPIWSARILEEWARATRKLGPGAEDVARAEIALLRADWPKAEVQVTPQLVETLTLPDPDDRHVLAAALASGAETLVTRNRSDFPTRLLRTYGVSPRDPDEFLTALHKTGDHLGAVGLAVCAKASRASGRVQPLRPLLKRAGLPRLGKALSDG